MPNEITMSFLLTAVTSKNRNFLNLLMVTFLKTKIFCILLTVQCPDNTGLFINKISEIGRAHV